MTYCLQSHKFVPLVGENLRQRNDELRGFCFCFFSSGLRINVRKPWVMAHLAVRPQSGLHLQQS